MIPPMHEVFASDLGNRRGRRLSSFWDLKIFLAQEVKVFLSKLEEACEAQQEVDIHVMFTRLTLDIIGQFRTLLV